MCTCAVRDRPRCGVCGKASICIVGCATSISGLDAEEGGVRLFLDRPRADRDGPVSGRSETHTALRKAQLRNKWLTGFTPLPIAYEFSNAPLT